MTHDEYSERGTTSLLKDMIANQHSLYEDLQAVVEKLNYLENRIEMVLTEVGKSEVSDSTPLPKSVTPAEADSVDPEATDESRESFGVIDLSGGEINDAVDGNNEDVGAEQTESVEVSGARLEPDDLYDAAEATVIENGKATQSLLQQELKIDAIRAKHLMVLLEAEGVVGPHRPGKSRQVKILMMKE